MSVNLMTIPVVEPLCPPTQPGPPTNAEGPGIHVSAAVLDAAQKDGDAVLRDLRTTSQGLTAADAEERGHTAGPNEVAQEKPPGWPTRLLNIVRNPLVI